MTVCLPLPRSLLTRRDRSRCHFCLSPNYSRAAVDSSHGTVPLSRIYLSIATGSMYRSFALSLSTRRPDCRCGNSRNAIHSLSLSLLLSSIVLSPFFRERYGSRPKIDRDRSTLAATLSNEKETISSAKQRSLRDLIATVDLFKRESITAVILFIRDSWKKTWKLKQH